MRGTEWWLCCLVLAAGVVAAPAAETQWWVLDTAADLLPGEGNGVAVSSEGQLLAESGWRTELTFDEPIVLASDVMPNGDLVVGTGHPAKLYRVRGGSAELLAELPGEQATSILASDNKTVWIATVAPGVLLRWRQGKGLEEVARLESGGFWALVMLEGTLYAAGGPPAALYKVGDNGLARWVELPDAFVRAMVVLDGSIIAGTSGKGLMIRIDADGRASLLADSPFTEISDLAVAPNGDLIAAALVGEPSSQPSGAGSSGESAKEPGATVQGEGAADLDLDLPKVNGKTATSEVFRVTPEGALLQIRRFPKQVASALAATADGVLVGTGYEGEVWFFNDDGGARLANIDAVQVVGFSEGGRELLTQGPAAVLRRDPRGDGPHRYRSPAKSFTGPVRFGRFRILPEDSGARIRFRTGSTSGKDPLWLPWSEFSGDASGPVDLTFGTALQWEIEIPPGGLVERVEVATREINLAPQIELVTVEPPGVIYLPGPPPSGPVIRKDHPTFEGMFTTVGADGAARGANHTGKKYYQIGYRTVGWKVEDPNGDALRFDLELEASGGGVLPVRRRFEESRISIDTKAVPDGRYRFRVVADDEETNPGAGLRDSATSEWFRVDNTAPVIEVEPFSEGWNVTVRDASPLVGAEIALNGSSWRAVAPVDGVLDGPVEVFQLNEKGEDDVVVFRAVDRFFNSTSVEVGR